METEYKPGKTRSQAGGFLWMFEGGILWSLNWTIGDRFKSARACGEVFHDNVTSVAHAIHIVIWIRSLVYKFSIGLNGMFFTR